MEVVEVHQDAAEEVARFLHETMEPKRPVADWRRLFHYPWHVPGTPFGYALVSGGKLGGFIGTIFSRRGGRLWCNISSWCVAERFRDGSLHLLVQATRRPDTVFTALSSTEAAMKIQKGFGFKPVGEGRFFRPLLPGPAALARLPRLRFVEEPPAIAAALCGEPAAILADHLGTPARHLLIESPDGQCYLLWAMRRKGPVRVPELLHASDGALLRRHVDEVLLRMAARQRTPGLLYEPRTAGGSLGASLNIKGRHVALAKFPKGMEPVPVDNAYTEYVVIFPARE